jgi:hypothetical protein
MAEEVSEERQAQLVAWQAQRADPEGLRKTYATGVKSNFDAAKKSDDRDQQFLVEKWDNFDAFWDDDDIREKFKYDLVAPDKTDLSDFDGFEDQKALNDAIGEAAKNNFIEAVKRKDMGARDRRDTDNLDSLKQQLDILNASCPKSPRARGAKECLQRVKNLQDRIEQLEAANKARDEKVEAAFGDTTTTAFSEQCFLMANLFEFVDHKRELDKAGLRGKSPAPRRVGPVIKDPKRIPEANGTNNASLIVDGSPYNFMNKMTQYSGYKQFFEMSVDDLSNLQPSIRLYKIIEEDGKEYEHEIKFASYLGALEGGATSLLKNSKQRGYGAGIQKFNFAFEGQDFYALKKSISAKLVIFANDFKELTKERSATIQVLNFSGRGPIGRTPSLESKSVKYKYVDLALKTGKAYSAEISNNLNIQSEEVFNNLDKLNFRLKAVVGWALPTSTSTLSTAARDAIKNSYITLQLQPTMHSFDFDDLGRVTFTLNYLAYSEDFYDDANFNIFTEEKAVQNSVMRQYETEVYNKYCDEKSNEKLREHQNEEITDDVERFFSNLMTRAIDDNIVFYAPLTYKQVKEFNDKGPYFDYEYNTEIAVATETMASEIIGDAENEVGPTEIMLRLQEMGAEDHPAGIAGSDVDMP